MKKNLNILEASNVDNSLRRDIAALKLLAAGEAGASVQSIGAEWYMADAKKLLAELDRLIELIPGGARMAIGKKLRQHRAEIADLEAEANH